MLPHWETKTEPEDDVSDTKELVDIDNIKWDAISVGVDGQVIDGAGNVVNDWDELAKLILATVNKISRLVKAAKGDGS